MLHAKTFIAPIKTEDYSHLWRDLPYKERLRVITELVDGFLNNAESQFMLWKLI